jgi:NADPH-dependent 2,4-dienoyl-CoA reductase/sulfur reductase-like enzyme
VTCVQNPVVGREAHWADLGHSDVRKKVVVVGGGPAGLEAARVAAGRGHDVVLFEREAELGGQTLIAKLAPSRQDFDGAPRWSSQQCRKLGVDIRLEVDADASHVLAEKPDAVLLATGARARRPALDGMDAVRMVSGWEVLLGEVEVGGVAIVIDEEYGHQAPTIAEFLLDRGVQVDLVTSQETIGSFLGATTRPPLLSRLFGKGGQLFAHLEAVAIQNRKLIANNTWTGAAHEMGPYDAFVYVYGGVRYDPLSDLLKQQNVAVEVIGDAFSPRSLQHAILEGHTYGRKV